MLYFLLYNLVLFKVQYLYDVRTGRGERVPKKANKSRLREWDSGKVGGG